MGETYMRIHHTATPTGEVLNICCPHCGKEIELTARLLPDNDMIVISYEGGEEHDETDRHIEET